MVDTIVAIVIVSAIAGFFAKLTDEIADRKIGGKIGYLFALIYGAAGAYLAGALQLATLWIAAASANVLARKIDCKYHALGLVVFVLGTLAFGITTFSIPLFMFFLFFAALDEVHVPAGKTDLVSSIISRRLTLVIMCLAVALVFGVWEYFVSILAFDVAYFVGEKAGWKLYPAKKVVAVKSVKKASKKKRK